MHERTFRRPGRPTLLSVAGLSLAGLTATGLTALAAPAGAATTVSTVHFSFSAQAGAEGKSYTVTGTGQADLSDGQASIQATLPSLSDLGLPIGGTSPTTLDVVVDKGTLYVSIPGVTDLLGAPWLSFTAPASDGSAGGAGQLASALGDVPSLVSDLSAYGTTSSLGTKTIDGTTATGTKVTVDVAKALSGANLPKGAGQAAAAVSTVPVSLWADASGRLVEASTAIDATTTAGSGTLTATVDFTGYGDPVTVTVPPASQTKSLAKGDLRQLLGGLGALGGSTTTGLVEGRTLLAALASHGAHHHHHAHHTTSA